MPKLKIKKIFKTGQNTMEWLKIDSPEIDQCCKCKEIVKEDEKLRNHSENGFSYTLLCPHCKNDSFYLYKEVSK